MCYCMSQACLGGLIYCKNERMSRVPLTKQRIPSLLVQRRFFTISASPMTLRATRKGGHILALSFDVFFPFNKFTSPEKHHFRISRLTSITIRKSCLFATDYGTHPTPVSRCAICYIVSSCACIFYTPEYNLPARGLAQQTISQETLSPHLVELTTDSDGYDNAYGRGPLMRQLVRLVETD